MLTDLPKPNSQLTNHKLFYARLKALVNEDTLLPMMFLGLRKLRNICCGHKMFLNKIRNIFLCPQQMLRARANGETFVSATMCPRLPGPLGKVHLI